MQPTDGLVRDAVVTDTGGPITVPVGDVTKGHVFNVLGETLDVPTSSLKITERWGIHRDPPPFDQLESRTEILETGIKVLDLLTPYVRGGKIGLFGGAGRGQDRADPGDDHPGGQELRRGLGVRGRGRADPRGQRPVHRDDRVQRHQGHRAGLRPDGRAAGHPAAGRPVRAHDGRVLPGRAGPGRAAVHRQHLPVHPGGLGGVHAARPDAVGGGLPADAGRRDGRAAGADHLHPRPLDHVHAGHLRARGRHHRPGAAYRVRPPGRDHGAVPGDHPEGDLPRGGPARLDLADPERGVRRAGALRRGARGAADPAAVQGAAGHHRDPRHRRAVRGGPGHRAARAADRAVPVPPHVRGRSSSPGSPGCSSR